MLQLPLSNPIDWLTLFSCFEELFCDSHEKIDEISEEKKNFTFETYQKYKKLVSEAKIGIRSRQIMKDGISNKSLILLNIERQNVTWRWLNFVQYQVTF